MKITDVSVTPIVVPLARTFSGSNYTVAQRCTLLVRIETDTGVVGETYVGDERVHYREEAELIRGPFRDDLIGEDLLATESIWHKMFRRTHESRHKYAAIRALSAVDIALWDAVGKALGVPLFRLLGAYARELPVVAFVYGDAEKSPDEIAADVAGLVEQGYAGIKLKVGRVGIDEDVRRVAAIRDLLGPGLIIGCDANRAWEPLDAIRFARAVEPLGVAWFEEPVTWQDQVEGMRAVRRATSIPIAAGQSELTTQASMQLVKHGAVDVLNTDVSYIGGVTEWRRMAAAASFEHVRLLHHEEPHVAVHLLCSVPNAMYVEVFPDRVRDPVWHDMVVGKPPIVDGRMGPSERPGLGLEFDRDFIRRYTLAEP